MFCSNRGLNCIRACAVAQSFDHQGQGFGNLVSMPAFAILLFQNYNVARIVKAGVAPGVMQQHQGE